MTRKNAARAAKKARRSSILGKLRTLRSKSVRKGTTEPKPL
jgi:hypothetical protein